jgi:hypothetical protein
MKSLILSSLFVLSSCTQFLQFAEDDYYEEFTGTNGTSILFSHNINGETHPCGCRNFPLGGLPQANGILQSVKKKNPIVYVDSGDTFFSTPIVPEMLKQSTKYTAENIALAMDKLGLKFFTPGDQDFAMGEEFLISIAKKHKFTFLITNSTEKMKIPHKKWGHIKTPNEDLFFLGVISQDLLKSEHRSLVTSSVSSLKKQIAELKSKYSNLKNKRFILLSHSGIDTDRNIAKSIPELDWIIGAHSQSYLRFSEDIGNTKLAQVLSRNHFIGEIHFPNNKKEAKYSIHETREESKDLISPNPMIEWLQNYKTKLDQILLTEQNMQMNDEVDNRITTYTSCSECHSDQVEFWQGTSHAIAYTTLKEAKAANNTSCIECHSLGFKSPEGFTHTQKIVKLTDDKQLDQYWNDFNSKIKITKSVRKMAATERRKIAKEWAKIDAKHEVTHNYANVQCLHCHTQSSEHPFDTSQGKLIKDIESACIKCHTKDQSPEWYQKDSKGLATSINKKYFSKKLKEVSCPKIEE